MLFEALLFEFSIFREILWKVVMKCKLIMFFLTFWAPFIKMFLFEVAKFYLTKYQVLNELNFFSGSFYL